METAIMVRDTIFWWIGNWAIFTALDAALWMGWQEYQRRREDDAYDDIIVSNEELLRRENILREGDKGDKHETDNA